MNPIYIDHNLIVAFFLREHPFHTEAVETVAMLMHEQKDCVSSLEEIYEACDELIKNMISAQEKNLTNKLLDLEKTVTSKVRAFMHKLHTTLLTTTNEHILSQAIALMNEYNIPFSTGFFAALMMEHKVKAIATVGNAYDRMISEGFLSKYGADE